MLLLYLAIALSIDAFSVGILIGLATSLKKQYIFYSLTVGSFHFLMPSLGSLTESLFFKTLVINGNKLMGVILILLAIQMIIDKKEEIIKTNYFSLMLLAFSVSIDSYFAGLGLKSLDISSSKFLVFSTMSFTFSLIGCKLGFLGSPNYKNSSRLIAVIILFVLGVKYLLL